MFAAADESASGHVDPRAIALAFNELLPDHRLVVTDGGHHVGFSATALDVQAPGDLRLTAYDYGAVDMGLGVAMGAAIARSERTTALFIGDGGMLMTLGDLVTAARRGSPLVVVVMNDRAYGAERHFLDLEGPAAPSRPVPGHRLRRDRRSSRNRERDDPLGRHAAQAGLAPRPSRITVAPGCKITPSVPAEWLRPCLRTCWGGELPSRARQ